MTVIQRVTAIYRAVIYRFDCTIQLLATTLKVTSTERDYFEDKLCGMDFIQWVWLKKITKFPYNFITFTGA